MNQVYVVTSGEYSDYGINAIFTTRELAEDYVDEMNIANGDFKPYYINAWTLDKAFKEMPVSDFCFINGKIIKLIDLGDDDCFTNEGSIIQYMFFDLRENAECRVLAITKEDFMNGLLKNNWTEKDGINMEKISFPVYCVLDVRYDKDKSVIDKTVYDAIAEYKALKEMI